MNNILKAEGRLRRTHYLLISIGLNFANVVIEATNEPVLLLLSLVLLWPALMTMIQRRHDAGKGPELAFICLGLVLVGAILTEFEAGIGALLMIPGFIAGLVILFARGTVGPNEYGPDPRGHAAPEEQDEQAARAPASISLEKGEA